jgi:hypothetical protein
LIQGTIAATEGTRRIATGSQLATDFRSEGEALKFLSLFGPNGPASWPTTEQQILQATTADAARDLASESTWSNLGLSKGTAKYWRLELADLAIVGLDTCNPWGGWDGSIDVPQFQWLQQVLRDDADRPIILVSHHPQTRLENDWGGPNAEARIGGAAILQSLNAHGQVLAWVAGHTHRHHVSRLPSSNGRGILSIETASLIDWPQQGRILEIFQSSPDDFFLTSTTINHLGAVSPVAGPGQILDPQVGQSDDELFWLAGLSRQLAVNDWQRQSGTYSVANLEGDTSARDFAVRL